MKNMKKIMIVALAVAATPVVNAQVIQTTRDIPTGLEGERGLAGGRSYARSAGYRGTGQRQQYAPGPVITKRGSNVKALLGREGENFQALTIIEAINAIPELSTLAEQIEQHPRIKELLATGKVTIFAPNNEAFNKIQSALAEKTVREVGDVLRNHVTKGRYTSDILPSTIATLNKNIAAAEVAAKLVEADIQTKNGVIHIINKVILPTNK